MLCILCSFLAALQLPTTFHWNVAEFNVHIGIHLIVLLIPTHNVMLLLCIRFIYGTAQV